MIKLILNGTLCLSFLLASCEAQNQWSPTESPTPSNSEIVVELLKSIETGSEDPIRYINPDKYIQHNLAVADGLDGFKALLAQIPPNSAKVNTVRVFEDGDYVFAHTAYDFSGLEIGFDVFRFENGLIVEHWDNLEAAPAQLNPSGRSMIDGATAVTDLQHTEANKQLVRNFVEDILLGQNPATLSSYFDGDNYIQHNPLIADNVSGLVEALQERAENGESVNYNEVHFVFGEGNFVLVVSETTITGKSFAMYDLFRVADNKIAEHWDTREEIPAQEDWQNPNGKF